MIDKPKKVLILGSGALQIGRTGREVGEVLNLLLKRLFNMSADKKVHFWEFPETTRFELQDEFREKIFSLASGGNNTLLSQKLGVSYAFISPLRRGVYSIPLTMLLKLSELSMVNLEDIEKNILFTRTRHGGKAVLNYPIKGNESMSALVGHAFGDGYISSKKRQFEYINFNPVLLEGVERKIFAEFGLVPISRKQNSLVFPAIVGDILLLFGAPVSPKLTSNSLIPGWIMGGSKEIKKSFLRAIFDDDGSVMFSENYRAKGINIYWTRHENNKINLSRLLFQVKSLLLEFGVVCGNPLTRNVKQYGDGVHVTMYINSTNLFSIKKFHEEINLSAGTKLDTLKKVLARDYSGKNRVSLEKSIALDVMGVKQLNG